MESGAGNPTDKMSLIIGGNKNSYSGQVNLVYGADSSATDMCLDTSKEEVHVLPTMDQDMEVSDPMLIDELTMNMENTGLKAKNESTVSPTAKSDHGNIGMTWTSSSSMPSSTSREAFFGTPGYIAGLQQLFRSPNVPIKVNISSISELAESAVHEIDALAQMEEPLWIRDIKHNTVVFNEEFYFMKFVREFTPYLMDFKSEASREVADVIMNPLHILEIFMKLDKWLAVFSGMISEAVLLEVLSTGAPETYNGAMQMIVAEFHALSPAIPTRKYIFVRCCKQLREGVWVVADFPIDPLLSKGGPIGRCMRRPSGCMIKAKEDGDSKVTWIEHAEIQDEVTHRLSRSIIRSGYAYGAKRWISILKQECERLASVQLLTECEDINEIVLQNPEGKKSVLKLAERMVSSFFGGVTASSGPYNWTHVYGNGVDDVKIKTRKSASSDLIISASMCLWIAVPPKVVFDYLCDNSTRTEWDVNAHGSIIQEIAYFGKGREKDNCVTILEIKDANTNEGNVAIMQETNYNETTSFVVFTRMDVSDVDFLFGGGNPDDFIVFPFGFTIIPSNPPPGYVGGVDYYGLTTNETLLSFAAQIECQPSTTDPAEAFDILKKLIKYALVKVKIGLGVAG